MCKLCRIVLFLFTVVVLLGTWIVVEEIADRFDGTEIDSESLGMTGIQFDSHFG